MKNFFNEKMMPAVMTFVNSKAIRALKDGLMFSMPLLIVGTIFLLLANIPIPSIAQVVTDTGLVDILSQAYGATFNLMAMIAAMGITYTYTKNEGYEPFGAAVISLACFILLQPATVTNDAGDLVNVIFKDWTSGKGMVCAIIVGLLVGICYSSLMKKNIKIKMPTGVPEGVSNAFSALIPAAIMVSITAFVYGFFKLAFNTTFVEWIYRVLQAPLQGLTDSFAGAIIIAGLVPFLWFFGIHGATIVYGVVLPLLTANSLSNQEILDAGKALTLENGGHIVTQQFWDQCLTISGSGITMGLVLYFVFFAKSTQYKELGKLGFLPSIFNVNEPVLFGTPVVLNPILAVPFIAMPILSSIIQYVALYTGICPLYGGIIVPWTTPPIISGFLVGGWRTALLQLFILALSFAVYFPFARKLDAISYEAEMASQTENYEPQTTANMEQAEA